MSRHEKNGITLKPIHIIIGVVAAAVIITAAVLFGLQQRPTQAESGFTPDLQEGTSAWSGDTLPSGWTSFATKFSQPIVRQVVVADTSPKIAAP